MHGASPKKHWVQESRRICLYRVWIPIAIIIFAGWLGTWGWAMLLVYPLQIVGLALQGARSARENWWRALFLVMGKFPEVAGQLKFCFNRFSGK